MTHSANSIGSKDVNIITSLGTTLLGLAGASASTVARVLCFTAMNGFGKYSLQQLLLDGATAKAWSPKTM